MSFDPGLSDRRALVTGGTKGVGAAVVEVLRENGVNVVTTARSIPPNSLAGVRYVAANITTAEGCTLVARSTLDHLGGIDIVVNVLGGSEAPAGGFAAVGDKLPPAAMARPTQHERRVAKRPFAALETIRVGTRQSVSAKQPIFSMRAIGGSHFCFCSSVRGRADPASFARSSAGPWAAARRAVHQRKQRCIQRYSRT